MEMTPMSETRKPHRDDVVIPFTVDSLDVRGRLVCIGPALDAILRRHDYPDAVSRLVAEAVAAAAMLGSALKIEGEFQVQTRGDGAVERIIADFSASGALRACARYDADKVKDGGAGAGLLGDGVLALTIDPGAEMKQYQGVVALDSSGFEGAVNRYFRDSEQIPTLIRLAVAEQFEGGEAHWRVGGIMAQHLPGPSGGEDDDSTPGNEDPNWEEARALLETVADHELVDPTEPGETLLYRLFHQQGVTAYADIGLREQCSCSRERVLAMLQGFPAEERRELVGADGRITVTCEFCGRVYGFTAEEV
ncbi:MAG: Hsp33 family molecular chaperone [Methylobacteriaceae bacterium]|jgi:molecular chaperone Hsp33|nr:Hsp33 family molecular chaperone [Methylobacteriaceae bacterium]